MIEPCKIVAAALEQGNDIVINQGLHEHGSLDIAKDTGDDADEHNDTKNDVSPSHIAKQSGKKLSGVFHPGSRSHTSSSFHAYSLTFLCHYASPPFSSKSPPLVWDS